MTVREKILDLTELLERRSAARDSGRRVVQCHGCFDIVHPGHIRHLRFARSQGEVLLVTITGDAQVGKGVGRPLIPEELRAENLAALDFVDWVFIDDHATAAELLELVRPDVYIKGREYESNSDPRFARERKTVETHGGRVVFSSGDVVFSSTALIHAMEQSIDPFHRRLSELHANDQLAGERLFRLLSSVRGKRIAIVGETILDTYVLCDQPEVARESPVMTLRPLEKRRYDGGAAILARHAAALGARPILVTTLPSNGAAESLIGRLEAEGVEVRPIRSGGAIAEKQRFLVGAQKVMKVDHVEPIVLDAREQDELVDAAASAARDAGDAAIIADFGLGLFSSSVLRRVCAKIRPHVGVLSGDVSGRRSELREMRGLDLVCPGEAELRDAYQMYDVGLSAAVWKLHEETATRATIVTMGAEGVVAFEPLPGADERDGEWRSRLRGEHVPALSAFAVDALGCGDALLTTATLTLAAGGSLLAAAYAGSVAASIESQRIGNVPVSMPDLRQGIARIQSAQLAFAPQEVVEARVSTPMGTPAA